MRIDPVPAAPAPADSAGAYKAVDGTVGEQFNGYHLMVEAYGIIWVILMGWLVVVWRGQSKLSSRIEGLEAAIARAEKKKG